MTTTPANDNDGPVGLRWTPKDEARWQARVENLTTRLRTWLYNRPYPDASFSIPEAAAWTGMTLAETQTALLELMDTGEVLD